MLAVFMAIAIVPVVAENTVEIPSNQIQIGKFVTGDPKLASCIIGECSRETVVQFSFQGSDSGTSSMRKKESAICV